MAGIVMIVHANSIAAKWTVVFIGLQLRFVVTIYQLIANFRPLTNFIHVLTTTTVKLQILFDDQFHCVVLKPAGMAVHGQGSQTLVHLLNGFNGPHSVRSWQPVHRLDFGTRGPVCVAKTNNAFRALQADWPRAQKTYHAWVCGAMPTSRGTARFAIDGKDSCTAFKTLGTRTWGVHGHATLVEWELFTGRTHQIRRHAAAMGHPVVGDLVYGSPPHYTGHGLHLTCTRLRWLHPNTKEAIEVSVAPAKKMIRAVPGQFEPVANARSEWLPLFAPDSRS